MKLDLGDLDGKMKLFETAAAFFLETLNEYDPLDLDDLVIDTLSGQASEAVNAGHDFDGMHDEADAKATEINNRGPEAQVAALLAIGWTPEDEFRHEAGDPEEWFGIFEVGRNNKLFPKGDLPEVVRGLFTGP